MEFIEKHTFDGLEHWNSHCGSQAITFMSTGDSVGSGCVVVGILTIDIKKQKTATFQFQYKRLIYYFRLIELFLDSKPFS